MKIGVNLPSNIPGVTGPTILAWARRAEAGPFSSIGATDRTAYSTYDPLITLASAASVTTRVRLVTNVLIAPVRNAGILAKEVASLDLLSDGRLTLGLGVGFRPDDYLVAPARFKDRGKRFDAQLALMKRAWAGEPVTADVPVIAPRPRGPELVIGAAAPEAIDRVGRYSAGYMSPPAKPETTAQFVALAQQSWAKHKRSGTPRCMSNAYFCLGPNAQQVAADYQNHYWFFDKEIAARTLKGVLTSPEGVRERIKGLAAIGIDELLLMPCSDDIRQLELLAAALP